MQVRKLIASLGAIAVGFLLALILLEVILEFLPVNEPFYTSRSVTEENPVLSFEKNGEFIYSSGWDFAIVNRLKTNNYGFVNDQDYVSESELPLLMVIGDSFVEAAMVPYSETLHGRLSAATKYSGRVYSIGASGAPLSQYLAFARFARKEFRPDGFVFVIVGNDFDESIISHGSVPGFHYFHANRKNGLRLRLLEYEPHHRTVFHKIGSMLGIGHLALVRYIRTNLPQLSRIVAEFVEDKGADGYVGNTSFSADEKRLRESRAAVDAFLAQVKAECGAPGDRILFVVDGMRSAIYDKGLGRLVDGSYFQVMRDYFISRAREKGFGIIDMHSVFSDDYGNRGLKFEFPTDGHWSGIGHGVAAEAVRDSLVFRDIFKKNSPEMN